MPMSTSRGGSMAGLPYSSSYGPLQPAGALSMHGSPFNFRNGSMNGHHYPIGPTRHSHPSTATNYNIGGLNEDVFDTYAQVPQYLLPGQDPQAAMSSYATHDMSRNWTPTSSSKPLTGYEHYSNSQFPHMNSSAMAAAGTEDSLLSRQGSRILPHPRKTSVDPSSHSYPKPGEFTSYLPLGYGQRSSVAYSPQTSVNWGSQGSASSTSLSSYSGPVSSASSSPPTECHTTPFGYNLSVCTTPIQPAVQPSRAPEDEPINDRTIRRRSLGPSRTTNVHTNAPIHVSSKAYSYNLNNGGKSDSAKEVSSPEFNTLVNKKPYQPIREKPINYNPSAPLPTEKASMIPTSKPTSTVAARQR
ncbi:MAG: hypothetical protein LQ352_006323 [Teloschistes flavicans]|nr:MAG: hypothetical protein LQ352_006323 [Teloschistes flavicans]